MKNIAVFASGNGTNFENIVKSIKKKNIKASVKILIVNKKNAYALTRAKNLNIKSVYVNPKKYETLEEYEHVIEDILSNYNIDLICLAGYMKIVGDVLLKEYPNKIINIHPALLPSFKGAHGIKDAFDYGCKVFGVTIHYVSEELDSGKIIAQRAFEYYGNDIDELEEKIHKVEYELYPETIDKIIKGENL